MPPSKFNSPYICLVEFLLYWVYCYSPCLEISETWSFTFYWVFLTKTIHGHYSYNFMLNKSMEKANASIKIIKISQKFVLLNWKGWSCRTPERQWGEKTFHPNILMTSMIRNSAGTPRLPPFLHRHFSPSYLSHVSFKVLVIHVYRGHTKKTRLSSQ